MGHCSVLVIGDNVDQQLAPYDGDLPVEPYSSKLAIESCTDSESRSSP
jgi:hypothetical protein